MNYVADIQNQDKWLPRPGFDRRSLAALLAISKLKTYAWVHENTNFKTPIVYSRDKHPLELVQEHLANTELPDGFVVKPDRAGGGRGLRVLTRGPAGHVQDLMGRLWLPEIIVEEMRKESFERKIKTKEWFCEELILPHPDHARDFLTMPRTILVLRYWFYAGRFMGGVFMAPTRKSEGFVLFAHGPNWGYFDHEGTIRAFSQPGFKPNNAVIEGKDFDGYKIPGAMGNGLLEALTKVALAWKPEGILRIDGTVDHTGTWVLGEIEHIQRAPTTNGRPKGMRNMKGLGC